MEIDWSKAPEGATHIHAGNYYQKNGGEWRLYGSGGEWIGTACHWKYLEENASKLIQGWTGEGLPPVGMICIITPHNTIWGFSSIADYQCKVIAYHNDCVWVDLVGVPGVPVATRIDKVNFSPVRTPEQIAEDERSAEINSLKDISIRANLNGIDPEAAIYDAGYRKQVTP